jgi:hypothetical protein
LLYPPFYKVYYIDIPLMEMKPNYKAKNHSSQLKSSNFMITY